MKRGDTINTNNRRLLRKTVYAAVLTALTVILTRFLGINTELIYLGFGELPVYLAGMLLGPWWGAAVGALGDVLGCLVKPMGAYFPGFTIAAAVPGLLAGIFLYNKNLNGRGGILRISLTVLVGQVFASLIISPLCLMLLYDKGFWIQLPGRLAEQGVLVFVYPAVIKLLSKPLRTIVKA